MRNTYDDLILQIQKEDRWIELLQTGQINLFPYEESYFKEINEGLKKDFIAQHSERKARLEAELKSIENMKATATEVGLAAAKEATETAAKVLTEETFKEQKRQEEERQRVADEEVKRKHAEDEARYKKELEEKNREIEAKDKVNASNQKSYSKQSKSY